jgi:hypothetical protein
VAKFDSVEFARIFQSQSVKATATQLGWDERAVYRKRKAVEDELGITLNPALAPASVYNPRAQFHITDGIIPVWGDAHYWPGPPTAAHKALLWFIQEHRKQIKAVVCNGDAIDGASISRHPPTWMETQPTVAEEMDVVSERMGEIEKVSGKLPRFWTLGNHDARFEMKLAAVAHQYRNVRGMHLKDHFPLWQPCWSLEAGPFLTHPETGQPLRHLDMIIKHRFKGGIHATHTNPLWSGRSMATNHLHSLKVTPLSDYNGTRYGVDCGCICDPRHPAFSYTEDNPLNWRSGFAVLTWSKGQLLWPEVVAVVDEDRSLVQFRGRVFKV